MIMPTEIVSANIDIVLSVKFIAVMKVNVATIVVGIVMAATIDPRTDRRKSRMTRTASMPPRSNSPLASWKLSLTNRERSWATMS